LKIIFVINLFVALLGLIPCFAADQTQQEVFLALPLVEAKALGQVEKLVVTVSCSWISSLKNVPELYDIKMGYDIPMENFFEAEPRLGGAAVDLSKWDRVVGVRIPQDNDSKKCFRVTVVAEGRLGAHRQWDGAQLGIPK